MVFGSRLSSFCLLSNFDNGSASGRSFIESKPTSGPSQAELPLVVVAQRADVVLLHPAATGVFRAKPGQHRRFKLRNFGVVNRAAGQATGKNGIQRGFIRFGKDHHIQRVIGHLAAVGSKMVKSFA